MPRNRRPPLPVKMPGSVNQLMQQAKQMQAEMHQLRAELLTKTFVGTCGGGVVSAVVRDDGSLDGLDLGGLLG